MASVRQFCFVVDPELGLSSTYAWPQAADNNTDGAMLTIGYIPSHLSTKINLLQSTMFIGGISMGAMLHTLRADKTMDGAVDFNMELITQNVQPTKYGSETRGKAEAPDNNRYIAIEFSGINPIDRNCSITFCKDTIDPHIYPPTWLTLDAPTSVPPHSSRMGIPSGIARWINFRIINHAASSARPVFDGFVIQFIRLFSREAKDNG